MSMSSEERRDVELRRDDAERELPKLRAELERQQKIWRCQSRLIRGFQALVPDEERSRLLREFADAMASEAGVEVCLMCGGKTDTMYEITGYAGTYLECARCFGPDSDELDDALDLLALWFSRFQGYTAGTPENMVVRTTALLRDHDRAPKDGPRQHV